ncbi:hypothetical protein BDF14DRAFT_1782731 [Spinellus fusiger]|nr:hypothetical protein BDF14DRAFT_1782731 [Spinellus fusiger]
MKFSLSTLCSSMWGRKRPKPSRIMDEHQNHNPASRPSYAYSFSDPMSLSTPVVSFSAASPDTRRNSWTSHSHSTVKLRKIPKGGRRVFVNLPLPPNELDTHGNTRTHYTSNQVRTSKYTLLTFVPKNLFEQFRRIANLYFLAMAILQLLPMFGIKSPALTLLPICVVVFISAIKDGLEDYERHKVDTHYNSTPTHTLVGYTNTNYSPQFITTDKRGVFEPCLAKEVRVGDFILLRNGECVPADAIVLSSANASNVCYVETKDLDGETNLKSRQGLEEYTDLQSGEACLDKCHFYIETGPPSPDLYSFQGTVTLLDKIFTGTGTGNGSSTTWKETKKVSLSGDHLLLRGHIVRNTPWVIAMVLFTGTDTKIMLNSGDTPSKRSQMERQMNRDIIVAFAVLFLLSFVCAAMSGILKQKNSRSAAGDLYSGQSESPAYTGFLNFWASLIIFQNIIPISLYVSIEFVKSFQAYFIWNDIEMWNTSTSQPCIPKSWNLSDDLGQIEYVFSDKTGTLTQNVMEFRECSIKGRRYGNNGFQPESEGALGARLRKGSSSASSASSASSISSISSISSTRTKPGTTGTKASPCYDFEEYLKAMHRVFQPCYASQDPTRLSFADQRVFEDLETQPDACTDFFTLLAVCHTVVVETVDANGQCKEVQDEKPKEEPIVVSSPITPAPILHTPLKASKQKIWKNLGLSKKKKKGVGKAFTTPSTVPVDPTVQVQLMYNAESPDEAALVSAARDCGFAFVSRQGSKVTVDCLGNILEYQVLRVLAFSSTRKRMSIIVRRPLPWNDIMLYCKGADNVMFERLKEGQVIVEESTQRDIEAFSKDGLRTLVLAQRILDPMDYEVWDLAMEEAVTATEGREERVEALQDKLECEFTLLGATGIEDKLQEGVPETIADLQRAGIKLWVLTGDKLETAINIGYACHLLTQDMTLCTLEDSHLSHLHELADTLAQSKGSNALVLQGSTLHSLLDTKETRALLLEIALLCKSVICCRVSPLQKALVVELVRKEKGAMTLAIGDGANDVSMIQAANVGIGIAGKEGAQAAMASDYSIAQFRFLRRLLLVQGHWNYGRIAEMVLNFFFKNIVWVLPSLWYQIYSQFSGNIFYDYSFLQLYNMIFTLIPVIVLGATDQDLSREDLGEYPEAYEVGIHQRLYTKTRFWLYFLDCLWQSLAVFYSFYFFYEPLPSAMGSGSMLEFSTSVAITIITLANLVPGFNTYYWTWIMFLAIAIELLIVMLWVVLYGSSSNTDIHGMASVLYSQGSFWLTFLLSFVLAFLPRFSLTFVRQWWFPNVIAAIRQKKGWKSSQSKDSKE